MATVVACTMSTSLPGELRARLFSMPPARDAGEIERKQRVVGFRVSYGQMGSSLN